MMVLLVTSIGCAGTTPWKGIIKIGLIAPFHGEHPAAAMAMHITIRDRLIARNVDGGIDGWRLGFVSLDDAGDPATAIARAAELIVDPAVVAAIVPADSVAQDRLRRAGVPVITFQRAGEAESAIDSTLRLLERVSESDSPDRRSVRDALGSR